MPENKFPPELRLKKQAEFNHVFEKRLRLSSRLYSINYCANQLPHSRIGFIFSKRQFKNAVSRNRLRRIAKEAFRLRQNEIFGWDLVIMAGHHALKAENTELRKCIDDLLTKLPHGRA